MVKSDFVNLKGNRQDAYLLSFIFLLQVIDNILRENNISNPIISGMKTLFVFFAIFLFSLQLFTKKNPVFFKKEMLLILLMYCSLLIVSFYWMFINRMYSWSIVTVGAMRIIVPIVLAFLVINVISFESIYDVMTFFLVTAFIGFIVMEIATGNFNFRMIFAFSLTDSTGSTMESNFFSPTAVSLCLFFGYFRNSKWRLLLSVLFTIMTYKRLMTLLAIFVLCFGGKVKDKKISVMLKLLFGVFFYFVTVYYIKLNLGLVNLEPIQRIFKMPIDQLTMGRTWMFQDIYFHGYVRQGLFTIINSGFRNPEMDLPNMYLEAGALSIIIVIIYMLMLARKNFYSFIIIAFTLIEMLTSHWLDITFYWVVIYITIGCIQYKGERDRDYDKDAQKFTRKIKKYSNNL